MADYRLKISELFYSLQGEGSHSGLPCSFIRLVGCALRCSYCDTEYAFHGGNWKSKKELFDFVSNNPTPYVQITGGEPLHHQKVWDLTRDLVLQKFKPLIETSGAVSIKDLDEKAHIVMDLKTPDSGESHRNHWDNLNHLKESDEIKFVICSLSDWMWVKQTVEEYKLDQKFQVLISPVHHFNHPDQLAEKVLQSGLKMRFQLQLHKLIWGEKPGT